MKVINTSKLPEANGHYSQCIEHKGVLYLSGQLPIDQVSKKIPESVEDQTDLVLKNVETILNEAGSSKNNVLRVRVYISDIALWDKVNERYGYFFENHKPARCIVPTRELHFGCLVEVEVTAFLED